MTTEKLLTTRSSSHGHFADNANMTKNVMDIVEQAPNWGAADATIKVAVFMIVHKLSRAMCGDPLFADHWQDIQGYAKLVEGTCTK